MIFYYNLYLLDLIILLLLIIILNFMIRLRFNLIFAIKLLLINFVFISDTNSRLKILFILLIYHIYDIFSITQLQILIFI
jgi:hypothetical protein